jgi:hypothetical protein
MLDCSQGKFKILLENVKLWFWGNLRKVLFIQYVFTLTVGKMANAIDHQRAIWKIQKPVEVRTYCKPTNIYCWQQIWLLYRDPTPLISFFLTAFFLFTGVFLFGFLQFSDEPRMDLWTSTEKVLRIIMINFLKTSSKAFNTFMKLWYSLYICTLWEHWMQAAFGSVWYFRPQEGS